MSSQYWLGVAIALAWMGVGGGIYEHVVIDHAWPRNPELIQPRNGGIDRKRFWILAHSLLELVLLTSLVLAWSTPARFALLVAVAAQLIQRIWSFADFIPEALRFETTEPSAISRVDAEKWVRRSRWRLLLALTVAAATFVALQVLLTWRTSV